MSDWYDSQKKPSGNFRKLLQDRSDKSNPRRTAYSSRAKTAFKAPLY